MVREGGKDGPLQGPEHGDQSSQDAEGVHHAPTHKQPLHSCLSILATVLFLLSEKLLERLSTLTALISPPPPHSSAQAIVALGPGGSNQAF